LITIDISELRSESSGLQTFLKEKVNVSITVEDSLLILDSKGKISLRDIKAFVKRFLHHKGLSETYRVTVKHGTIKISKHKHKESKGTDRKGTPPSSYDTLPYYFPAHP